MTKADYQNDLNRGYIGQIEYKLHKDKTWIAQLFTSLDDEKEHKKRLKRLNYKIDKVVYFELEVKKLDNPNLTVTEKMQNLIDYLHELKQKDLHIK